MLQLLDEAKNGLRSITNRSAVKLQKALSVSAGASVLEVTRNQIRQAATGRKQSWQPEQASAPTMRSPVCCNRLLGSQRCPGCSHQRHHREQRTCAANRCRARTVGGRDALWQAFADVFGQPAAMGSTAAVVAKRDKSVRQVCKPATSAHGCMRAAPTRQHSRFRIHLLPYEIGPPR